jgi:hypothetical protein
MLKRVVLHLAFWVLSFLIFTKSTAVGNVGYVDWFYSAIWFCILIPIFYSSFASVFLLDTKKVDEEKKFTGWRQFVYAPITAYVFGMMNIILQAANHQDGIFRLILRFSFIPDNVFIVPEQNNFISLSYILIFMSFGLLLAAGEYVLKQQRMKEELAQEKQLRLEAENRTILQQVNPHFLYNTLNAIYAQAIKGSENVKESLLTLSELMRYPVSLSSENKWVSFQTELAQIKRYVELQKLRFTNRVMVIVKDKTDGEVFNVPPLLLMIPIENAFKHGYLIHASLVEIVFEKVGHELHFSVTNPINLEKPTEMNKPSQKSTGQGLVQLKEGLNLLYGNMYRMEHKMNEANKTYEFSLFLPLKPKKA